MGDRSSIANLAESNTGKLLASALVAGFTAGGVVFAWNASHISRAEAAEMIVNRVPNAQEASDHEALFTLGNDVKVLLGRDRVRYAARRKAKTPEQRDDAELDAVSVYDSEVSHGTPVEQAIAAAVGRQL